MKPLKIIVLLTLLFVLTLTNCKKECFKSDDCNLEGKAGPCFGLHPGYHYDKKEKKCKEFIWGGCGGVLPFATMEDCEKSCRCN